ncbi:MAG TPA: hypothetical protein LFV91_00915 [Rickettsia endosymbiont of Bembidion nr. Transversale]|nr:hypothetical protein [Rickettsia endosymbiont of Bembidion nr. Transversale]
MDPVDKPRDDNLHP